MRFIRHGLAARVAGIVAAVLLVVMTSGAPAVAGHGGPNHWNKQGNARVNLYIVDRTGAAWPVGTAVTQWVNAASSTGADITPYYRTSSLCPIVQDRRAEGVTGDTYVNGGRRCGRTTADTGLWPRSVSSTNATMASWILYQETDPRALMAAIRQHRRNPA